MVVDNINTTAAQATGTLPCPLCGVPIHPSANGIKNHNDLNHTPTPIGGSYGRLVRIAPPFLTDLVKAAAGPDAHISVHWGEPDKDGVYEPMFTKRYGDPLTFPKPPVGINHANLGDALHRVALVHNGLLHQGGRGCDCAVVAKAALDLIAKEARRG